MCASHQITLQQLQGPYIVVTESLLAARNEVLQQMALSTPEFQSHFICVNRACFGGLFSVPSPMPGRANDFSTRPYARQGQCFLYQTLCQAGPVASVPDPMPGRASVFSTRPYARQGQCFQYQTLCQAGPSSLVKAQRHYRSMGP